MIPQTFPSVLDSDNRTKMVIYMLSNITGLTKWIDYIPVKSPANEGDLTLVNKYEANGFIYTTSLPDIAGKQAWLDYIPVYIDGSATTSWSDDPTGYIPMSGLAALLLDFTTMTSLDLKITFSRTSNATVTNSLGNIGYAPHNLLTYSEQFDNAAWTKQNVTVAANSTTAPDGTSTADTITSAATNGYIYQTFSAIAGTTYTFSCYVKSVSTATTLQIALLNASGASGINAVSFTTTSDWTRVSVTGTSATTQTAWVAFGTGGTFSTGETLYVWGAQCEIGSTATTYNPTTVKNLLGYTEAFDNAAWTKSNSFVQTNLLTYSEDFSNAAWSKIRSSVSANAVIAPNGYQTADKLIEDTTAANNHSTGQFTNSTPISVPVTASVYLKAAERTFAQITLTDNAANVNSGINSYSVAIDLSDGSTGTQVLSGSPTNTSFTVTNAGNGWWRLTASLTKKADATRTDFSIFTWTSKNAALNPAYTGDGTSGIYIWGAQLVQGSDAGAYRRTDAAALPVFYPNHNGVVCAEKLVEDTATSSHQISNLATGITTGTNYTFSIYAKAAERNWLLLFTTAGATNIGAWFDLTNGVIGTKQAGNVSASIISVGNGWYRCSITGTSTSTSFTPALRVTTGDNTSSYTGNGTSGIYIFGAQLSDSASLDPYVLNAAAAPSAQAYYGARFDYDPVTQQSKGLLIEEQRVNIALQSADFSTTWSLNNILAFGSGSVANATTSPDGTQNADKIVPSAVGGAHFVSQTTTVTNGASYTTTVYAKPAGYSWILLWSNTASTGAYFDVQNGTIGTVSAGVTASITSVGNGWYRCSITKTTASVAEVIAIMAATGNNGFNFTGDGTSGVYLWGAQLEAGAFATSYIPTAASSVTRAADVAVIQGSNFYSWYNQNEGSVYCNYIGIKTNAFAYDITNGSTNNRIYLRYLGSPIQSQIFYVDNTVTQAQIFDATGSGIDTAKTATAYKINDFSVRTNGGTSVGANAIDSSGNTPILNQVTLGATVSNTSQICGTIKQFSYYNTRLPNSTLASLTA